MDYNEIRKREGKKPLRQDKTIMLVLLIVVLIAVIAVFIALIHKSKKTEETVQPTSIPAAVINESTPKPTAEITAEPVITPTAAPVSNRGTAQDIPQDIRNTMDGKSMHTNNNISYSDLSYLSIPHYNFNYEVEVGHLVVNKAVAEEVLDIFAELYDVKYPIERMEIVDMYGADDYTSIDHNNTSAFNYRESTDGTGRLSKHALGRAIDINPQINPYVNSSGSGSHSNAAEYWSRNPENWTSEIAKAAYIGPGTEIYRIFVEEHGWEWGGAWSSYRDYQHFQKY